MLFVKEKNRQKLYIIPNKKSDDVHWIWLAWIASLQLCVCTDLCDWRVVDLNKWQDIVAKTHAKALKIISIWFNWILSRFDISPLVAIQHKRQALVLSLSCSLAQYIILTHTQITCVCSLRKYGPQNGTMSLMNNSNLSRLSTKSSW